ncbi:hypothetical protein JCGZ_02414 [Jatropha curcas]|uniref:Aminotransferase-like plant mobile domain-containing protein n=1 Tax=Jatropha curcas TaxID=180498 RepID=A0A067LHW2_JATCU|nr:hypothetical protein JCGZ_02414 [Jatropha curcas]
MKIPSKLGLIGLKDFNLIIWPPTQLARFDRLLWAPIGSVVISKIWFDEDTFEARFGRLEGCWFCPGQLRNSPSLTEKGSSNSFAIHHHCLEVWAYEYRIYPGGPSSDGPADSQRIPRALSDLLLTPWEGEAWRTFPGREVAELYTRSRFLLQGYWLDWYFLGERVYDLPAAPAQRRVPHAPPRHMCMLEGMTAEDREDEYEGSVVGAFLSAGDYAEYFSTRMQARLPEVFEYTQERKKHKTAAHYRA